MLQIPPEIYTKFNLILDNRNIPKNEHNNFKNGSDITLIFAKNIIALNQKVRVFRPLLKNYRKNVNRLINKSKLRMR